MSVSYWIVSLSIALVALGFVALVIFLGVTLVSLRRTIADVDDKVQALTPFFRVISKTGEAVERKADRSLRRCAAEERATVERELAQKDYVLNTTLDVARWTLEGITLWQKIRERK